MKKQVALKTTDRREFGKLVEFCEKNSGIAVLVEKTDRLYRNLFDKVKLDCQALDIEIHLVKENQILSKNSNSKDSFMNNIHTSVAILYSENLSEEAKKRLRRKKPLKELILHLLLMVTKMRIKKLYLIVRKVF